MSDPISVRHVIASSDYSERIQKTDAVRDQATREHFAQELERREELKRTQVNESEQDEEVQLREEEERRRQEEEKKRRKAAEAEAEEQPAEELEEPEDHIIDLKV